MQLTWIRDQTSTGILFHYSTKTTASPFLSNFTQSPLPIARASRIFDTTSRGQAHLVFVMAPCVFFFESLFSHVSLHLLVHLITTLPVLA